MTQTTQTQKRASAAEIGDGPRQLWLRIAFDPSGELTDQVVPVPRAGLLIGRGSDCGLVLNEKVASRNHAVLRGVRGGGYVLLDLGSSNGTTQNGAQIDEAAVEAGDVLRFGDTVALALDAEPVPLSDELGLIGRTPTIARLREQIRRLAPLALPVLVRGPTGAGKELVSSALHACSGRRGALVPINSAALPHQLVESALFGHRKGAFTHATADADGAFRAAHHGTLFLDEIGDMPLEVQPKLLRALEAAEITPVGASRPIPVDVRFVAATHVDLAAAVAAGRFREDLWARLAAVDLSVPGLSSHRDDVMPLLEALLPPAAGRPRWSADVVEALLAWPWPRHVRELRNVAARLGLLAEGGGPWRLDHLLEPMRAPATFAALRAAAARGGDAATPALAAAGAVGAGAAPAAAGAGAGEHGDDDGAAADPRFVLAGPPDKDTLVELLAAVDGNVSELARRVGRSRKQVYRWMHRHDLAPTDDS